MLFSTFLACVITFADLWRFYNSELDTMGQQQHKLLEAFSAPVSRSLWLLDGPNTVSLINSILSWDEVVAVEVVQNAQEKMSVGSSQGLDTLILEQELVYRENDHDYPVGVIRLISDRSDIRIEMQSRLLEILLINSVKTCSVAIFALLLFHSVVRTRLNSLMTHIRLMHRFPDIRPLSVSNSPASADELDHIVNELNDLNERLQSSSELIEQQRFQVENELKVQSDALSVAHSRLLERDRLATVGSLLGMVAHEIRNPLGTIINSTLLLKRVLLKANPAAQSAFERIESSVVRCDKIVHNLKDLSGTETQLLVQVELRAWVSKCIAEEVAVGPEVALVMHVGDTPALVEVDEFKLSQIVRNLVQNSLDSFGDRRLKLAGVDSALATEARDEIKLSITVGEDSVELELRDNGPGSDVASVQRLLDPLYTTKIYGFGMGLSICKRFAEMMGGRLAVEPSEAGFTARLTLPRVL